MLSGSEFGYSRQEDNSTVSVFCNSVLPACGYCSAAFNAAVSSAPHELSGIINRCLFKIENSGIRFWISAPISASALYGVRGEIAPVSVMDLDCKLVSKTKCYRL